MNGVVVDPGDYGRTREELMTHLMDNNVETRLFFLGMHRQPSLLKFGCDGNGQYPVADRLTENGFYLPSASSLTEEKIAYICGLIREFRKKRLY
jgi:perosamine synthetase